MILRNDPSVVEILLIKFLQDVNSFVDSYSHTIKYKKRVCPRHTELSIAELHETISIAPDS